MLVVDLCCTQGHVFEGWFGSADDLARQQAERLVQCPVCGDAEVRRLPSASHIQTRSAAPAAETPGTASRGGMTDGPSEADRASGSGEGDAARAQALLAHVQRVWMEAARHIVANTEDVGERFADEARAINHGDAPERGIRGQATPEQRAELREEGIEVMSMPLPDAVKKPVH